MPASLPQVAGRERAETVDGGSERAIRGTLPGVNDEPSDPAPVPRAGELNRALFDFVRAAGRTRALPVTLHVGRPGRPGGETVVADAAWYDAALRADLAELALSCVDHPEPFAWLTRSGALVAGDRDHEWCAAVRAAAGRLGLPELDFYVVTRQGWLHLASGSCQQWSRVRPSRRRAG